MVGVRWRSMLIVVAARANHGRMDYDVRPRFSWRRHVGVPLFYLAIAVLLGFLIMVSGSDL